MQRAVILVRFNSATAKRPWRTSRPRQFRKAPRFNSATAKRPWRTVRGWNQPSRISRRFNSATAKRPWRTHAHIGGHSQKAVENLSQPRAQLQFGHSQKAVENLGHVRHLRNGYLVASIRPQPKGRGERGLPSIVHARGMLLQFGHSQKAVENALPGRAASASRERIAPDASIRPQPKGRGEPAAYQRTGAVECFNSATAKRPWRTQPLDTKDASLLRLGQFGHSQKAVENSTFVRPWPVGVPSSFNSATAKRPWRTRLKDGPKWNL